jgi:hypothetical protein
MDMLKVLPYIRTQGNRHSKQLDELCGREHGKEEFVKFKLKKMSQSGITRGLWKASSGTRTIRKGPILSSKT